MIELINSGQKITIELANSEYATSEEVETQIPIDWVQLDQLKTYNDGFL